MPLDGISESPEAKITQAFYAVLKADSLIAASFHPIVLVESPTREAFNALTVWTMALIPFRVKIVASGNKWVLYFDVLVSAYLPKEDTERDSALSGLDLGNHVRKLAWNSAELGGRTVGAIDFTHLPTLEPKDTAVRILSFQITFQTDIDAETGQLI